MNHYPYCGRPAAMGRVRNSCTPSVWRDFIWRRIVQRFNGGEFLNAALFPVAAAKHEDPDNLEDNVQDDYISSMLVDTTGGSIVVVVVVVVMVVVLMMMVVKVVVVVVVVLMVVVLMIMVVV